ncbi:ubiquitin-conjugating enzyme E2 8-like [Teleopsis dalmanni]|uniref:ubiquitin-conjugating enzyme E2 8-like n=1 Tax=Teleopsis dalmanni TaxID=139649 RepID=UPI0018CEE250|nr:ubiquitin-conjugating enzyme E2 8-like [Teleopsis dalmanni]
MAYVNLFERRIAKDVKQLMESNYDVTLINGYYLFHVKFHGPMNSLYKKGTWSVQVIVPTSYPHRPPDITFLNKIYHPNIDILFGAVCLNLINEDWSPKFTLFNVFEHFLPGLLYQPNPKDPLNLIAANALRNSPKDYAEKVADYVRFFAIDDDAEGIDSEEKKLSRKELSVALLENDEFEFDFVAGDPL